MRTTLSLATLGLGLFLTSQAHAQEGPVQGPQQPVVRRPRRCSEMFPTAAEIRACEDGRALDAGMMEERNAGKAEQLGKMQTARKVRHAVGILGRIFPVPGEMPGFEVSGVVGLVHQYEGLLPGQSTVNIRPGVLLRAALADYFNGALWLRVALELPSPALGGLFRDPEPPMAMMEGQMPAVDQHVSDPSMLTDQQKSLIKKMDRTALDLAGGLELRILGYDLKGTGYWQGLGIFAGMGGWINPGSLYWEAGGSVNLKWFTIRAGAQGPMWGIWKDLGGGKKIGIDLTIRFLGL